ncbi:MAG: hypothetical protein K8T90_11975 [Planctomycetes bacterium]|nr:hypothetical protein [Planctomycetota bacterium]
MNARRACASAARVVAAAAALGLAAGQANTWWAEQSYEAGIRAIDPRTGVEASDAPARDVPGRLEAYASAVERDPTQPLFALRAGQIQLHRVAGRPLLPDRSERLAASRALLERAATLHPLDGRTHDALASACVLAGDTDGAVARTRAALLLIPRSLAGLNAAAARLAWVWRRTMDPDVLAACVDAARLGFELYDGRDEQVSQGRTIGGAWPARELLLAPSGPLIDDLLLALRGRPDLLETAARLVDDARPDAARRLRAESTATGGR